MEIIDAWMQHPSAEFLADPMFESLRRWARGSLAGGEVPVAATVAAMDQAGVRTGLLCPSDFGGRERDHRRLDAASVGGVPEGSGV